MSRTGMLEVDVRGECVERRAGVWRVGVFVAGVEGTRVRSLPVADVGYVHTYLSPPTMTTVSNYYIEILSS